MWRSFFYAVGFSLIIGGLQSLMFERVIIANGDDVPMFVKRFFENETATATDFLPEAAVPESVRTNKLSTAGQGSAFGPSRFGNGGLGGGSFSAAPYRSYSRSDLNTGSGASGITVPRVDLAGYETRVSEASSQPVAGVSRRGRVLYAKDWMPWSLLAAGTVVLLYTRSSSR